jgi:hypothetical protein
MATLLALGSAATATTAQAKPATGQAFVIQGIADTAVDVYVDSKAIRKAVPVKTIVGPLDLAPGPHVLALRSGSAVVAEASFAVTSGGSSDLIAHRFPDAARAPSITTFVNDLSSVPPGKARLLIAHTAVVGPADVIVNGKVLLTNVANGESATNVVPAGKYTVSIVPTATTGPAVLGPATLPISAGALTNVFAVGDPVAGTMDAVVHVLGTATDGAGMPARVDTGNGGQAAALLARDRADGAGPGGVGLPLTAAGAVASMALLLVLVAARQARPGAAQRICRSRR